MKTTPYIGIASSALVVALAALCCAGVVMASPDVTGSRVEENRVIVTLESGEFEFVPASDPTGDTERIEMKSFGRIQVPGQPALPMQRFLVALPPGARATSIEILGLTSRDIGDHHRIAPAPPIAFLGDMPGWDDATQRVRDEWQAEYDAVYLNGATFPAEAAWLAAKGSYRQVAYASVAFCPFTYHPLSGRIEHHAGIEIAIHFETSSADAPRIAPDAITEARAADLFSNYATVADLYRTGGDGPPSPDDTYDFVIITTDACLGALNASDFPAWKADRGYSLRTLLTTDPEIASQPGVDLAEKIRNCLRSNYLQWGTRYVLMVGDYAEVPMRICYPDPDFHVYDPWDPGLIAPGTPTDYYFADLSYDDDVSWDSDGDGYHGEYGHDDPDFLAEVSVGRIPVNSGSRIVYSLNKLVAFEQDTGAWKRNVLHGGSILFFENQNGSGYPFIDGASCLDSIEVGLMDGFSITHFTERAGIVQSLYDWPAITEYSFTNAWGTGQHAVVNWSGHGWPDGAYRTIWAWDDGDGIPEHGNGELQSHRFIGLGSGNIDDDHPSIVFAISCNVGYPDPNPYGNLGIDLLTLPGWGASAGIVSSARPAAISGDWRNDPGGTEQICYDFNRYLLVEAERVGDALYDGKFSATSEYGWDRVYEYMNLYNFNLFGDPSMDMGAATVGVSADTEADVAILGHGMPNPFAAVTSVRFTLPAAGTLRVSVLDVAGRHVATLADGRFDAGSHAVMWDGTNDRGERIAAGTYFVVGDAAGRRIARKLVLLP